MPVEAKYLYVVMMDIEPDKEAEFNQRYDGEHIPYLMDVPGVLSAARFKTAVDGVPKYLAIYEMTGPDVPDSAAFREAMNRGEWPQRIRPHTKNRSLALYTRIYPKD